MAKIDHYTVKGEKGAFDISYLRSDLASEKSFGRRVDIYMFYDGVQPKTPPISTRHLIWVNYKVLSKLSQLIFLSFSYLNNARHNVVIELCRALRML